MGAAIGIDFHISIDARCSHDDDGHQDGDAVRRPGATYSAFTAGFAGTAYGTLTVTGDPHGGFYARGEYCPNADAGLTTADAGGNILTCVFESGRYHWH